MNTRQTFLLISLLFAALIIRLYFFIPIQGSDDLGYNKAAHELATGAYQLKPQEFYLRFGMIVPMSLSLKLFGVSPLGSSLYLILCSLSLIVIVFIAGWYFFNPVIGWLAAILLTVFPLNIHAATELHTDLPMSLFLGLSFLHFVKAYEVTTTRSQVLWGLAAGVWGGIAYLTKIPAVLLFPGFVFFYALFTKRWIWPAMGSAIFGFGIFLLGEALIGFIKAGDPLFHLHAILQQAHMKDINETYAGWQSGLYTLLTVYPNMMFNVLTFENAYFGWYYYLATGGLILFRKQNRFDWFSHPLVIYTIVTFLILNFAVSNPSTLAPVQHHVPRTLDPLTLSCVIWAAVLLYQCTTRWRTFVLTMTALASMAHIWALKTDAEYATSSIRNAYHDVISKLDAGAGASIVTDSRSAAILRYLSGYTIEATPFEHYTDRETPPRAYIVVDAYRLAWLERYYGYQPDDIFIHPPDNWELVYRTIPENRASFREEWSRGNWIINPFMMVPDTQNSLVIFRVSS